MIAVAEIISIRGKFFRKKKILQINRIRRRISGQLLQIILKHTVIIENEHYILRILIY